MSARILVVEDNPNNLELMRYLLEAAGHEVVVAMSGMETMGIVRARMPHLAIFDVQLQDTDGYSLLQELREYPQASEIPVLAVTAFAMAGERDRALDAGFNGYLSKPIDPVTFVQRVDAHLPSELRSIWPRSISITAEDKD